MVERLLQETSDLASQKFSLASCLMCACKNGYREVVGLLVREEGVLLDVTNKSGLSPEEVTTDPEIRKLLRQEHWRRAKLEVSNVHCPSLSQVGREAEVLEQQERREMEVSKRFVVSFRLYISYL